MLLLILALLKNQGLIPEHVIEELQVCVINNETENKDVIIWKASNSGQFS